jgi:tRNA G10  N-methylase Trm11
VFTPFAGIGSEVYQAVKFGRRALGIELKPSYWRTAVANLRELEAEMALPSLFDLEAAS